MLAHAVQREKERKGTQIRWEKLSRFEGDPVVYVENTKKPTQKKLSTTYKGLREVSGHKLTHSHQLHFCRLAMSPCTLEMAVRFVGLTKHTQTGTLNTTC